MSYFPPWFKKLIILAVFSLLLFLNFQKIHSLDAWGHIAIGRYIVENKTLPLQDVFSFTAQGRPFYNFSWAYQILIYLVYLLGSLPALIIIKTLVVGLAFLLLFLIGYKKIPFIFLVFVFLIAVLTAQVRFFLRPEIFTFLFISIYLFLISKYFEQGKIWIYFLPLIQVFWTNFHSLSILGPGILISYLGGEYVIKKVNLPFKWNEQGNLDNNQIKKLFLVSIGCLIGMLINPYGYKIFNHYKSLFTTLNIHNKILPCGIQELQPISFNISNLISMNMPYFKILVIICVVTILLNIKRQHITTFLIFLTFLYLAKISRRNIGLFSIIAWFTFYPNAKGVFNKYTLGKLRKYKMYKILNIILMFGIIFLCYYNFKEIWDQDAYIDGKIIKRVGIGDNPVYPQGAYNFITQNNIKGNMFNSFNFGHYLLWKMYPERKVFIDGRIGLYQDNILTAYANTLLYQDSIRDVIERYDINYFLLETSSTRFLNKFLYQNNQWKLVYFSPQAIIYIKNTSQNRAIIKKFEVKFDNWQEKLTKLKQINKNYYSKFKPEFISLINEGLFFKTIGKLGLSKLAFEESINLNPNLLNPYLQLSTIYIAKHDYRNAIKILNKALKTGLTSNILYTNLGYSYEKIGQLEKSIKLYKKAVNKWPGIPSGDAYTNLARIYYEKGRFKKALIYANKAINLNPNSFLNHYTKGTILLRMGLYGDGVKSLQKTIKLNPSFAKGYNNLGLAYYKLGMINRAKKSLNKAVELDSSLETAKQLLQKIN